MRKLFAFLMQYAGTAGLEAVNAADGASIEWIEEPSLLIVELAVGKIIRSAEIYAGIHNGSLAETSKDRPP